MILRENQNGVLVGIANHTYHLQGKFYPILKIRDKFGTKCEHSLEIIIQHDPLPFEIELTTSSKPFPNDLISEAEGILWKFL